MIRKSSIYLSCFADFFVLKIFRIENEVLKSDYVWHIFLLLHRRPELKIRF